MIEAGAGTGKTSTLKLLASSTKRRGQYLAFNKSIVDESSQKMPSTVHCNTAHSLAFRAVGYRYKHRLSGPRQRNFEVARILGIREPFKVETKTAGRIDLSVNKLADRVLYGISTFCKTADPQPSRGHLPPLVGVSAEANNTLGEYLEPWLLKAWADLQDTKGQLRFQHDHYLKAWQLSNPRIDSDYILFDEAQDANPVMSAVVQAQRHAQLVFVGDSQQQIYSFTGAVNALAGLKTDHRIYLTQSFRFGPAVADIANLVLAQLDAPLRLTGTVSIPSEICELDKPKAILTRTNARAIAVLISRQMVGQKVHLIGEGKEILSFARAAQDLKEGRSTEHPDLVCFKSWNEVVDYAQLDEHGDDLALNVRLAEQFGCAAIQKALDKAVSEKDADLIISTVHKSKGREWPSVLLGSDFIRTRKIYERGELVGESLIPPEPEELRLLYVATTRAKLQLDISSVESLVFGEDS